jgi:hypothetical protein
MFFGGVFEKHPKTQEKIEEKIGGSIRFFVDFFVKCYGHRFFTKICGGVFEPPR